MSEAEASGGGRKKKHRKHEEEHAMVHDESNWLVSYADMMTLLFGFFVLMFAFSRIDTNKFTVVRKELAKHFGGKVQENPAHKKAVKEIEQVMASSGFGKEEVKIVPAEGSIELRFQGNILFKSGSAEILPAAQDVLARVINVVRERLTPNEITVEGHTDDEPMYSRNFPTNWELSSARASRVVREFEEAGFAPHELKAEGYGSSRPIVPNRNERGEAIPENQERNRRVLVRITFDDKLEDATKALAMDEFKIVDGTEDLDQEKKEAPKPPTFNEIQSQQMQAVQDRLREATSRLKDAERKVTQAEKLAELERKAIATEKAAKAAEIKAFRVEKDLRDGSLIDKEKGEPAKGKGKGKRRKKGAAGKSAKAAGAKAANAKTAEPSWEEVPGSGAYDAPTGAAPAGSAPAAEPAAAPAEQAAPAGGNASPFARPSGP